MTFVLSQKINDYTGNALRVLQHYQEQVDNAKILPNQKDTDSPMEAKLLDWIKQSKFYQKNSEFLEITTQFNIGKYLKSLNPNCRIPNFRCDF